METCDKTDAEYEAMLMLADFIETDLPEASVKACAGALMRLSVSLAVELMGPDRGAVAAREALENIINQRKTRTLQ